MEIIRKQDPHGFVRSYTTATCGVCNKEFLARVYDLKRGQGKVCSVKCRCILGQRKKKEVVQCVTPPYKDLRERNRAHGLINMRIRRGKLVRPTHCPKCGQQKRVDAHHKDYTKPDEIEWVCRSCHMKEHYPSKAIVA